MIGFGEAGGQFVLPDRLSALAVPALRKNMTEVLQGCKVFGLTNSSDLRNGGAYGSFDAIAIGSRQFAKILEEFLDSHSGSKLPVAELDWKGAPVCILQAEFGRATVNLIDRPLVEHAHREFNILFKLGGHDSVFRVGDQDMVLDDNAVLIFRSWMPHAKASNTEGPSLILSMLVEPQCLVRLLGTPGATPETLFPNVREEISEEIQLYAYRFAAAISNQLTSEKVDGQDLATDLLRALAREYADPALARNVLAAARPVDYRIRKALAYIRDHATESLKSDDIARMVGLSRSRFFEQFRRCVGATPQHYIDWTRLGIATRWLSNSDRPLTELAEKLGFSAHSHFTRFFTQHVGVAPSEFRRQTMGMTEVSRQDQKQEDNIT